MALCPSCGGELAANAPAGMCAACLFRGGAAMAPKTTAAADFEPPEPEVLGVIFPEYEIVGLIGRGGMGAVYKARQLSVGRTVALKILPESAASDAEFAERFRREAAAMASLDHPNIVTLHDFGERDWCFFFVMEYVDGVDLAQRLTAGSLTTDEALVLVPQICDALQYSHDKGVVHRDIKPGNILIDRRGKVKIADFGLAKLIGEDGDEFDLTKTSASLGTPRYMAPEQMSGGSSADHRADIYALGVVLYEILTGEVPAGRFEPPSARVAGLADHFDEVILRAMNADPEKRFEQVSELKSGLLEAGELEKRLPGGTRQVARRYWWGSVFPAAVVSALLGAFGVWWFAVREKGGDVDGNIEVLNTELARLYAEDRPDKSEVEVNGVLVLDYAIGGDGKFEVGLLKDRRVKVWGDSSYGQKDGAEKLRDIVDVDAGEGKRGAHVIALDERGRVFVWGDNTYKQCEIPTEVRSGVVAIEAGEFHSLALRQDGRVVAWGYSRDGAVTVPVEAQSGVKAIAAGPSFNLALLESGELVAWGANDLGQCDVPSGLGKVRSISTDGNRVRAELADGTLREWGG